MEEEKKQEPEEKKSYTGDETITDTTNIVVADSIIDAKEDHSKNHLHHFRGRLRHAFSIREDVATHQQIKERIECGGKVTGENMVIMICAIIIASVGLNVGSTAVIIGAMLISPLMGRILLLSYGTCSANKKMFLTGLWGFFLQIVISVSVSCIFFLISPQKEATEEIIARTQPTFYDVLIAFAGGIAGMVAQTRKSEYNNVIPGVAIATALMPPLCTVGYSLANSQWEMMAGAAYLFLINFYFIYLGGVIVLAILEVPKVREMTVRQWRKIRMWTIFITIVVTIPAIMITVFMFTRPKEVAEASSYLVDTLKNFF